jgi:hypothetical protein
MARAVTPLSCSRIGKCDFMQMSIQAKYDMKDNYALSPRRGLSATLPQRDACGMTATHLIQ